MKESVFNGYGQLDAILKQQVVTVIPPSPSDKVPYGDCVIDAFDEDAVGSVYRDTVEVKIPLAPPSIVVDPEFDPWALPEIVESENERKWKDLSTCEKVKLVLWGYIGKCLLLLLLLYTFVCSLDVLSSAFRLLGGRTAGAVFRDSNLLNNPVAGLMIGVLATVLVQSSSTSTSIVVSMVASEILTVPVAIPMIMGANIGTSMTNTLVSVAHSTDRAEFRRAFAGATVHDMFNWLTVLVLLPLEVATGYLYISTSAIVNCMNLNANHSQPPQLLTVITEPLTHRIIQLDKVKLENLAMGSSSEENFSLIKKYCNIGSEKLVFELTRNDTSVDSNETSLVILDGNQKLCGHIFAYADFSDTVVGVILLVVSLGLLIACLICIVKLLHSVLRGHVASVVRKTMNADLPGCWSFLTGYLAILVGAAMTILVQSSSVFTSALTPLVGIGVLDVARMYPLTLGSNVGTTFTSVLAAMASPGRTMASALQIALCHLLFNLSGILLFYPVPFMRRLPIRAAKFLGNKTADYRWFAVLYVLLMFFILPAVVFGLSALGGGWALLAVGAPTALLITLITILNVLQNKCPARLPESLRAWDFLPLWMRSLEPMDGVVRKAMDVCSCCKWCRTPDVDPTVGVGRTLPASESRRKLISADSSRTTSRAGSPKASLKRTPTTTLFLPDIDEHVIDPPQKRRFL